MNASVLNDTVNDVMSNIVVDEVIANVGVNAVSGVGNAQINSFTCCPHAMCPFAPATTELELCAEPSAELHVTNARRHLEQRSATMRRLMIMVLGVLAYRTLAKHGHKFDHQKAMG